MRLPTEVSAIHFIGIGGIGMSGIAELLANLGLADKANAYIATAKPWEIAKQEGKDAELHQVCSEGLAMFRLLTLYLKPILPKLAQRAEDPLGEEQHEDDQHHADEQQARGGEARSGDDRLLEFVAGFGQVPLQPRHQAVVHDPQIPADVCQPGDRKSVV